MDNLDLNSAEVPKVLNYCFFAGYSENVYPSVLAYNDQQVLISGRLDIHVVCIVTICMWVWIWVLSCIYANVLYIIIVIHTLYTVYIRIFYYYILYPYIYALLWFTLLVSTGPPVPAQDQFSRCIETIKPLLVKYNNDYCNVVYNGQCSINGAYQPSVAEPNERRFIGKVLMLVCIYYLYICRVWYMYINAIAIMIYNNSSYNTY